tara:strand:- start:799 stop:1260 length:462 start_codon:yes stop_codon:yes gene_type:complete
MKVFSILNNFVRIYSNQTREWNDLVDLTNPKAIQVNGKHNGKLSDINSVDICMEGTVSIEEWKSTSIHKDGGITGKALLSHYDFVQNSRGLTDKPQARPLIVDEDSVYQVVAKKVKGSTKASVLRHVTVDGINLTYVTVRIPKASMPATECAL